VVCGLVLAGCGRVTAATRRAAAVPEAPAWQSLGSVELESAPLGSGVGAQSARRRGTDQGGGATGQGRAAGLRNPRDATGGTALSGDLLTGYVVAPYPASTLSVPHQGQPNHRPLFIAYEVSLRVSTGGLRLARVVDITPEGITTRGGLVVSAAPRVLYAGIGSYRYELDGVVAFSRDGGRQWSESVVPGELDPTPGNLLALGPRTVLALVGAGTGTELVESTDAGASWQSLGTAKALLAGALSRVAPRLGRATTCVLSGLGELAGTVLLGTSCRGTSTGLLLGRPASEVTARGPFRAVELPLGTRARSTEIRTTPPDLKGAVGSASPALLRVVESRGRAELVVVPACVVARQLRPARSTASALPCAISPPLQLKRGDAALLATGPASSAGPPSAGSPPPSGAAPRLTAVILIRHEAEDASTATLVLWRPAGRRVWEIDRQISALGGDPSGLELLSGGQLVVSTSDRGQPALVLADIGAGTERVVTLPSPETATGLPGAGS